MGHGSLLVTSSAKTREPQTASPEDAMGSPRPDPVLWPRRDEPTRSALARAPPGTSRIGQCTKAKPLVAGPFKSQVQVAEAGGLQGGDVPLAGVLLGVDVPGHCQPAADLFDGSEPVLFAPGVEAIEKERGVRNAIT